MSAINAGRASSALSCLNAMASYTPRGLPAPAAKVLDMPAAPCRRGGRTKSTLTSVLRLWRFFTVLRARLPASARPGIACGVCRGGGLRDASGVPVIEDNGAQSVCRRLPMSPNTGQPSRGRGHRALPLMRYTVPPMKGGTTNGQCTVCRYAVPPRGVPDFTSLTLDEFQQLVPPFSRLHSKPRWRRGALMENPGPPASFACIRTAPRRHRKIGWFFILTYLKTYALQVLQGRQFGMARAKNQ